MYILKPGEAQRRYLDEMTSAFPDLFKPDPKDYDTKMLITISRHDTFVMVEIAAYPPRLPVSITIGVSAKIDGHEVESGEQKILVLSIVSDLVETIDAINPLDKDVIRFQPTQQ